jgi:DNA polymerase sigma
VNESIPDYELKIYGSHATNLCLPWSDLDLVLVPKNNNSYMPSNNNQSLQLLYYCLLVRINNVRKNNGKNQ